MGFWSGLSTMVTAGRGEHRGAARMALRHLPPDCVGIAFDRGAVLAADKPALSAIDQTLRVGDPTSRLLYLLTQAAPPIEAPLRALIDRGEGFRVSARLADGRYEVHGRPVAGLCKLTLRRIGTDETTVEAATAERDALRAVLEAHGIAAWIEDNGDERSWHTANAASDAVDRASAIATDLPDGRRLFTARPEATEAAEAMLRRFVETVSETFTNLRAGLAIFDHDRRLTLSNPALGALFGVEPRFLGARPTLRHLLDHLREIRQLPEQADFPAWRARLFTLFEGAAHLEDIWDLPDGRSLQVVARPHPMGGVVFVVEDITETVAMQRWRSTAVEVRRATLDQMPDAVLVIGPDGRARIANPAFADQWSMTHDTVEGAHLADLVGHASAIVEDGASESDADGLGFWARVLAFVAMGEARAAWHARLTMEDGRVLRARVAPMPDGSTLVITSDATDSERIADALRERATAVETAEQMRHALVDHLARRLRAPLDAITCLVETILHDGEGVGGDVLNTRLANIGENARRMAAAVESLGDLVSIHVASSAEGPGAVAVNGALRGAVGLLSRRADERGVDVDLEEEGAEAIVWGQPNRIRQAVYRLIAEAVEVAPRGASLIVGGDHDGDSVVVWCAGFGERPSAPENAPIDVEGGARDGWRLVTRLPVRAAANATAE